MSPHTLLAHRLARKTAARYGRALFAFCAAPLTHLHTSTLDTRGSECGNFLTPKAVGHVAAHPFGTPTSTEDCGQIWEGTFCILRCTAHSPPYLDPRHSGFRVRELFDTQSCRPCRRTPFWHTD